MQDYAIGASMFTSEQAKTATTTPGILIGANPNRALLIVTHVDANSIWVSTLQDGIAGVGFHLGTGDQPLILNWQEHGNLPSKAWYVVAITGDAKFSVLEGEFDLARAKDFIRKFA